MFGKLDLSEIKISSTFSLLYGKALKKILTFLWHEIFFYGQSICFFQIYFIFHNICF